ncbi:uncharacterized protein [Nicotiana sylvestris]|uniref:uncharacterized protein n=1 Tax=Nicotiana sylvestris TaxID=4096 RepID=UPI00388C732C
MGIEGLNYEDLCIQPHVELPKGYKPPMFEMFDGTRYLRVHLRTYCDKLNLKKKPTETFCEYATRWRSKATKVRPALEEEQMNKFFVRAQDLQYYERLMLIKNYKFSDIIKLGERIEEGIKSVMVTNFEALQATNKALQSSGTSKKRDAGTYTAIAEPIDQLYERLKAAGYVTPIPTITLENPPQWVNPNKSCAYHSGMKGHALDGCRSLKDKIQTLIDNKIIVEKEPTLNFRNNPLSYHKGGGVHMIEIEDDWNPKGSISLITEVDDPKKPIVTLNPIVVQIEPSGDIELNMSMPLEFEAPSSAKMPMPIEVEFMSLENASTPFEIAILLPKDYTVKARRKGKVKFGEAVAAQGMTRTGRVYILEHLADSSKQASSRPTITETGPEDLWRKIQAKEYSIIDQLNKTPTQISILALLQNSDAHKNALLRVMSEAYVPSNITGGEMENMVGQVLESHNITFHEDELPPEGLSHNKALHITVQCEDYLSLES